MKDNYQRMLEEAEEKRLKEEEQEKAFRDKQLPLWKEWQKRRSVK